MSLKANIFIPDISGYTEFLSRTELEHSSHILNELLSTLVDSNCTDLTLLEIEGDALLFYKKGDPLTFEQMVHQAIEMFRNFHIRLKIIERDSVCQCGACKTVSNLSLKFIVHYGEISEISVSTFVKASGINLVIAHRLMKNRIESREYILATEQYCSSTHDQSASQNLTWTESFEEYPALGRISFRYAPLEQFRSSVTVPDRELLAALQADDILKMTIEAPIEAVYEGITNLNGRSRWTQGLKGSSGNDPLDRLYSLHQCHFDDYTVEISPVMREVGKDRIRYVETGGPPGSDEKILFVFELIRETDIRTVVTIQIGSPSGSRLPKEIVAAVMSQLQGNAESLKRFLESGAGTATRESP